MESILTSIKKLLGIHEDYEHFDTDIIMNINSAFMDLRLLGVGPTEGFSIEDEGAVWTDFLGDATDLEGVKMYIYLKVKLIFDPPQSSAVLSKYDEKIRELEWKLNVTVDPKPTA